MCSSDLLQIQQAAADKLDAIIEDKVGGAVATAADNLATKSIPLGSSLVASIAQEVIAEAPGVLATAGVTPASVAGMVHGEIGLWKKGMTSVTPPARKCRARNSRPWRAPRPWRRWQPCRSGWRDGAAHCQ